MKLDFERDGSADDLSGKQAVFRLLHSSNRRVLRYLVSPTDITISGGTVYIHPFTLPAQEGRFPYEFSFVTPDGSETTYLTGDIPIRRRP